MSLPKLFGKEFLPDPNILLNNYDIFMNDPNMNTFLNGSAPKYNPNPNINLRYLYGPDYKIKDTEVSAPEPSKTIQIEITIFDKNHWNFPTNQTNTITDHPKDTELIVTNALKGLRTYNDMVLKNLHKNVINASEIDLYVSNNTFKFDATLTTELFDSYQEPTFERTPEQIAENIEIAKLVKDIFSLNIQVNKTIGFSKDGYLPNLNITYSGETYGVDKLYIPDSYKQQLQTELKAIEVAPENKDLSEDTMIGMYQSKAEEILEPLYKDVFYGIKIIPDSTKRTVQYKDIGQPDMLLFPKENIKLFEDTVDPLYKIVEFHRPGAYNLGFTYGDVPFPNIQDSLKLLKDQTIVQTNSKLYVYNGNETDTAVYVGQQLTFDINDTPGLQAISGRLDTTTSLKVEKPAILETENYFFAVGGKNKNSLSPNFNLKNIISFAPKIKNGTEGAESTEIGMFTEVATSEDANYIQTKNLIETLKIDSENCYFQTINNSIFAFVFTYTDTPANGFMYIYKVTLEEIETDGTTYPILKFQIKTVNQNYFKYPTFKLQEDLHKIYVNAEAYSSSYSKLLIIDSAVSFQNQTITTIPLGQSSGTTVTTKPTEYEAKLLEFIYEPETDQFALLPKTIVYSDTSKEVIFPNGVLTSAIKTEVSETQEEQNNNNIITKTYDNVIELSPYLIEDNNNTKTLKKSFLLCHGIWETPTSNLWDSSSEKVFTLLNEAAYINYGIDINQKNFYKNLRKGKEQSLETNGAILLINPVIGNITYSGAIQINKVYTSTQLYGKPQVEIDRNIPSIQLLKAAYYSRQEEVLFQSLLVRKIQDYKAYNESVKFYDESAPNGWNEDKYLTLQPINAPIVLTEDSKEFFEYLLNLCYETRLDKYNDYYYLATYSESEKNEFNLKLIIPEFFFDLIFNRQMFNINLKVLEWYWDNYIFEDENFQTHKNNLKYKESSFTKENIRNVLVSFYKNKIKMSRPSVLNGSEDTNLYEPIIENIQKKLEQFQSDIKYTSYNFIQNNIQDPSLYQNNIDTSNLKIFEDFKYIIVPNENGSIVSDLYLIEIHNYMKAGDIKGTTNINNIKQSKCTVEKNYSSISDDDFLKKIIETIDYFVAPNGNDNNDGKTIFTAKKTCYDIPNGANVLFLPGTYTDKIIFNELHSNGGYYTKSMNLCFVGAIGKNLYGFGDKTIIDSRNKGGIYQPIICRMKPKNKSDVVHGKIINNNDIVWSSYANTTIFNMKILWNHNSITWSGWDHQVGLIHDGNITCKNIDFQIFSSASSTYYNTPNYFNCSNNILGLSRVSGTPNIQNNVQLTYIEESILNLDLLFLHFIDLTQRKEITFHPHKQRYKPSYTLIPLASSGFYDISQNDLVDLGTEAKKNINLPVLNDTRAMSNLTNFKITL